MDALKTTPFAFATLVVLANLVGILPLEVSVVVAAAILLGGAMARLSLP